LRLSSRLTALARSGVEFIDENGGGPGVRLRKGVKNKSRKKIENRLKRVQAI
jgi:hypothetical protein